MVDNPGTPFSLSRLPHFDLASFLDFQRVKQTSQATSETWRQRDVSESSGTPGSPASVKASSDGRELLFLDSSGVSGVIGVSRRYYVNVDPVSLPTPSICVPFVLLDTSKRNLRADRNRADAELGFRSKQCLRFASRWPVRQARPCSGFDAEKRRYITSLRPRYCSW